VCEARQYTLSEIYAAADPQTAASFVTMQARIDATSYWSSCANVIDRATAAGVAQQKQVAGTASPPPPAPSAVPFVPPPSANHMTTLNTLEPNLATGWQIDSYYCGAADGAGAQDADAAGKKLAQAADAQQRVGGEILGLVRTGPTSHSQSGHVIFYDANEKTLAAAIKTLVDTPTVAYTLTLNTDSPTRWYISIFSCP